MKCWKCHKNIESVIAEEAWLAEVDNVDDSGEHLDWESTDFDPEDNAKIKYLCPNCYAFLTEDESEAVEILKNKNSKETVKKPNIEEFIEELKETYGLK